MKRFLLIVSICIAATFSHFEAKAQVADTTFSVSTSANPFDDQVVINVNQANKNVTGIKIFDAIGKEVSAEIPVTFSKGGGVLSYTLDFTHMRPGVYFCTIYSDKGILETRKLFRAAR
ncbi:MAG TPA: T9SS type A sorting domain-containing protein [Cytophagaceae bacterium]|jgi:hypothetical protein|nr:T9SS type A sorting domain-containing protein [Cytophagaceae bacterium]